MTPQQPPPIQEQLNYPEPHRTDPPPGHLQSNQLALSDPNIEVMGEWPWPHYPRGAARNYIKTSSGKYEPLPGHHGEKYTGWEGDFLGAMRNSGILRSACLSADVSVRLIAIRLHGDANFSQAYKEAQLQAADLLEAEARRRAMQGVTREKYQLVKDPKTGGMVPMLVETVTEYSDKLLIVLMQANNPGKFKPDAQEHHSQVALEDYARQVARSKGYTQEQEEALVGEARRIYNGQK